MKRTFLAAAAVVVALGAGGCAHPISLQADSSSFVGSNKSTPKIDRRAALAVSDEDKKREVTTPGGGGDKVSYFPYRDLETGLYVAMSEAFSSVSKVTSLSDPKIAQEGITVVLVPEITTHSHSPSLVTWPPTVFTIDVAATLKAPDNRTLKQFKVQGEGRAEFDEFKNDHSLSAKRAAQDLVNKLIKVLNDSAAQLR